MCILLRNSGARIACYSKRRESGGHLATPAVRSKKQKQFLVLVNETSDFLAEKLLFNSSSRIYFEVHPRATELSGMGLLLFWQNYTCTFVRCQGEMPRFGALLAGYCVGLVPVLSPVLLWRGRFFVPACTPDLHFWSSFSKLRWGERMLKKSCSLFSARERADFHCNAFVFLLILFQTTLFQSVKSFIHSRS